MRRRLSRGPNSIFKRLDEAPEGIEEAVRALDPESKHFVRIQPQAYPRGAPDAVRAAVEATLCELERTGRPVLLANARHRIDKAYRPIFSPHWIAENNHDAAMPRNTRTGDDADMRATFGDFLENYLSQDGERWYLKDFPMPIQWRAALRDAWPELFAFGPHSNDLMFHLGVRDPNRMMIYFGRPGTCSPLHTDPVLSFGHNCMLWEEEFGKGCSYWFFFPPENYNAVRNKLAEFNLDVASDKVVPALSHLLEVPGPVYLVKQQIGDMVLVPSLALHVVLNRGSCTTMKLAWNTIPLHILPLTVVAADEINRVRRKPEVYQVDTIAIRLSTKLIEVLSQSETTDDKEKARTTLHHLAYMRVLVPVLTHILHRDGILAQNPYRLLKFAHSLTAMAQGPVIDQHILVADQLAALREDSAIASADDTRGVYEQPAQVHGVITSPQGFEQYPVCDHCNRDIGLRFVQCCGDHGLDHDGDPRDHDLCIPCWRDGVRCWRDGHNRAVLKELIASRDVLTILDIFEQHLRKYDVKCFSLPVICDPPLEPLPDDSSLDMDE